MNIRVLQIGSDRSKRGILHKESDAAERQRAYAEVFGALDIIAFSLQTDGARPYVLDELHVYPTHSPRKISYGWDAWHILRSIPKPDVISVQDPFEAGILGLLFSKIVQVPLHVQVHTDFLSSAYKQHSFLNRFRVLLGLFVLRRSSRIRVVSERIKSAIQNSKFKIQAPVTELPIFVDVEKFRNTPVAEELQKKFSAYQKKLLFVGRFEPEKNPCLVLRAFAEAAPQDTCLIMVGDGSERAYLEQRAHELGIHSHVFFEGLQDPAPYYKIADLLLVTSRYEGYGLVIVEALASGTPVLATDVGIAREAGARVAQADEYGEALKSLLKTGFPVSELNLDIPARFEDYVQAYCADVCGNTDQAHNATQ